MNLFILLISATVLIIASYYFSTFNYWKKRGVKTLKPNLLLGNLSSIFLRKVPIYRIFEEVYKTCKTNGDKFMGFYFFNKPAVVLAHPELVKQVLVKDFDNFTDRPFYYNEQDPFTIHIISAKGNQWRKMREQFSPAFSPSKLKNMCHTLLQVGIQLKAALDKSAENQEVVNLNDVSSKYVIDVIGMGVFGIECNTLQNLNIEFMTFAECVLGGSFTQNIKFILSMLCPSVLQFFRIPLNSPKIENFYLNLVKSTVEFREKNNFVRNDLMHSIIQLRNNIDIEKEENFSLTNVSENEKSLKIQEIAAQVLIIFGGVYESATKVISQCIFELASNEDIQNILKKEIVSVLEKFERKLSYDAIMEMTYLDKCVLETLRKYVGVGAISRICTKKYKFPYSDIILDVGTPVYIPIYEIHHDPEYYPNPEKFDPERFSSENKSKRPSYTFLSFGEGQRNCLGTRLGLLLVKIFLITFVNNYNFTINSKVQLPPTFKKNSLLVIFENPIFLNIEKI